MRDEKGGLERLLDARDELRLKWRDARNARLRLRDEMMSNGKTVQYVRHDSRYRTLKKIQGACSVRLRQIDREISRELSLRQRIK